MIRLSGLCLLVVTSCTAVAQQAQTHLGDWQAVLSAPVARYGHNIMGDVPEWSRLCLYKSGKPACVDLPENAVFEDIAPRLSDLDEDGQPEVILVQSSTKGGAALTIYHWDEGRLKKRAAGPDFGQPNRWLAPVGIADFNGDGRNDIAYIETPHLGKILKIWTLRDNRLVQIGQGAGLTNHRIGDNFISGGVRDCGGRPEMITVDAAWKRIIASELKDGTVHQRDLGRFQGATSLRRALGC